ncbi:hypothetical protein PIB30_073258 [Stylosanthes scabra]|uniref:Uncharacterized protein n=1 Tax=Stylosanthes scabra TaxID=79078 RepID=A0ABU6RP83_9FABA|nr:hypothetical protein [Stylosanthes scabra]
MGNLPLKKITPPVQPILIFSLLPSPFSFTPATPTHPSAAAASLASPAIVSLRAFLFVSLAVGFFRRCLCSAHLRALLLTASLASETGETLAVVLTTLWIDNWSEI